MCRCDVKPKQTNKQTRGHIWPLSREMRDLQGAHYKEIMIHTIFKFGNVFFKVFRNLKKKVIVLVFQSLIQLCNAVHTYFFVKYNSFISK
jgi:hypothetical protein